MHLYNYRNKQVASNYFTDYMPNTVNKETQYLVKTVRYLNA